MTIAGSLGIVIPILDDGNSDIVLLQLDKIFSIPHFDPTFDSKKFKLKLKKIGVILENPKI